MISWIHKRMEDREEGFTLIELLVVVIIIGILAAVAIPVFLRQRERAYAATVQSDLRNVAIGVETFFTQEQEYPDATEFATIMSEASLPSDTNVTLAWDATAAAGTFCIDGTHALLTTGGTPIAFSYSSAAGGLQPEGTAC